MGAYTYSNGAALSATILEGFTTVLTAYVGVIILSVFLPFVASLVLDGIVHVFRGRGLKPLLIAVVFTGVVVIAGVFAISYGQPATGIAPETLAGMTSVAQMLLPFSIGLALFAFAIRMLSMLLKGSKSRPVRA